MCGICGFFSPGKEVSVEGLEAVNHAMRHRGPDDEGFVALVKGELELYKGNDTVTNLHSLPPLNSLHTSQLILGHRRLSIIDLSVAGHQPVLDSSRRYAMVFNGEIYNYIELRRELEAKGHRFKTEGDTEVVLQSWISWGDAAFNRFNGMWAIAIWDNIEKRLMLSRDRFGVKPLYIAQHNGCWYFASEIKALIRWPGLSFQPNELAIQNYLDSCLLNDGAQTFWSGIEELRPGHLLHVDSRGVATSTRYWSFTPHESAYKAGEAEEKFAQLFEDSLRLRMRSDVEVGTLLSGGLDSNTIVFGLHELGLSGSRQFKAFSAVFTEEAFSEEKYIDRTLSKLPLKGYKIFPHPDDLRDDFSKLMYHVDEPFRSLSVYSQYKIYQLMSRDTDVRVVLNGQGADELFAGYSYHYYDLFIELLRRRRFGEVVDEIRRFSKSRAVSFLSIAHQILRRSINGTGGFSERLFRDVTVSPLREYLKYDDRTSMAFSVEARAPFLDYRLVEFAFSLPTEYKIRGFENKRLERDYAKHIVPAEIVQRKDKMGFVSPQQLWQKRELKQWLDETFARIRIHKTHFDGKAADALYKRYCAGRYDAWDHIWRYFCLLHWLEQHAIK